MIWQWCVCGRSGHKRNGRVGNQAVNYEMMRQHSMIDTSSAWQWRTVLLDLDSWQNDVTLVFLCPSPPAIRQRLLQCGLHARVPLYRIHLMQNHQCLWLEWDCLHWYWRVDCQQLVFSNESALICDREMVASTFRRWTSERQLPECFIQSDTERTPRMMIWGALRYHRKSQQLRILCDLNSNRYIRDNLKPEVVPAFNAFLVLYFRRTMLIDILLRIAKPSFQRNRCISFPSLPVHSIWRLLNILSEILLIRVLRLTPSCSWYRWNFILNRSNLDRSSLC